MLHGNSGAPNVRNLCIIFKMLEYDIAMNFDAVVALGEDKIVRLDKVLRASRRRAATRLSRQELPPNNQQQAMTDST